MPIKCSNDKCEKNSNNALITPIGDGLFLCEKHLEEAKARQNKINALIEDYYKIVKELQELGVEFKQG